MRIGIAIAILLASGVALGQGKPALRVVLDGIGPEAAACGISGPAIQAVAARTSTDAADPYLRQLERVPRKTEGYVVVCEAGRLLSGAQRELPGAVNKAFEQDIKSCLSQLRY